ncbi:type II toxin-antitoxin system VapC family toxin [Acidobacteria bacterium AH-259-A15]|nr:type II toxin-antitoxin system VapC family toxin [Acidobacteria bacterium AH-259-A15]
MIVLDTHVWVWWISDPKRLSTRARKAIQRARADNAIYISSISVWEVALLVLRGRLRLTMDVRDWIAKSEDLPFVNFVPVDNRIALRSTSLPGRLHSDPADRIIIATALSMGAPLVTQDKRILRYPHIKTKVD